MKKVAFNIILLVFGILIGLGTVEVGFRIKERLMRPRGMKNPALDAYDDKANFDNHEQGIAQMEYDSYLGYLPQSNFNGIGYHHNRDHFRYNEDIPTQKEANEIRIFVTGGSTAWGVGVPQKEMYSAIMEELFAQKYPGKKIRVISAGAGGYCSTQERIMLENRVLSFAPDYVVMLSGWNDTYFGYRGKRILLDNDFLSYRNRIIPQRNPISALDPPDYYKHSVKLKYYLDLFRFRQIYPTRESLARAIVANEIPVDETVSTLLRNVHIVNNISKNFGFKFLYYLQPCVYSTQKTVSPWEKSLVEWGKYNEMGFPEYLSRVYASFRKTLPQDAAENSYVFYDADEAIKDEKRSVFADSVHLGDRGNRLIGEYLFRKMDPMLKLETERPALRVSMEK